MEPTERDKELARLRAENERLREASRLMLLCLDDLTTEEFRHGGDHDARENLREAIAGKEQS